MNNSGPWKKNSGMSLLLLAITLLLISTLLVLFAARYSSLQQKISSNLYRNQQALEAAQAGIEAAIPYFQTNYSAIVAKAGGGYLTPYVNASTSDVALANGSSYSFVFTNPVANNYQLITITATGVNADGTSTRVVTQQIQSYGTSSLTVPTVTAQTQGNMILNNSASINNTTTNQNALAGSFVEFNNSAHTTTSSGTTSSSSRLGSDVTEDDASVASEPSATLFKNTFGTTESAVQSAANYTYTNSQNTSYSALLNGVTGALIWINQIGGTASLTGSATLGSTAKPVILIVEGNLELDNSVTIYGFVFVLNPTTDTNLNNSATINGAIASTTHDINFNNSATLNYNASVLNTLPPVSGSSTGTYAKVPASWRDF